MEVNVLILWFALACQDAPPEAPPVQAPPPTTEAKVADPGAAHAAGGHMQQMAATRDRLRAELGEAYDLPVPGFEGADAARGKELYDVHCAGCHGATGLGDGAAGAGLQPPPADFTDSFHARYYSDAARVRIIEKGSPETAMVGFEDRLEGPQILDVYAYVRSFRGDPH
jgi:mono/diheme cytochrome c family protein